MVDSSPKKPPWSVREARTAEVRETGSREERIRRRSSVGRDSRGMVDGVYAKTNVWTWRFFQRWKMKHVRCVSREEDKRSHAVRSRSGKSQTKLYPIYFSITYISHQGVPTKHPTKPI